MINQQLNKYLLESGPTWKYVQDNLDKTNALSIELLNLLDFKKGYFFTLLPEEANIESIHNFDAGWILPPNPVQEYYINGHKAFYSLKKSIRDELSLLMLKEMEIKNLLSFVFDDVLASPKDKYYTLFSDNFSLFHNEEVYYLLNKSNFSLDLIMKCLKSSNSIWHSLCVFTAANLNDVTKTISLDKIREICIHTKLLMVGAYDGEGYIFWEKTDANSREGMFESIERKN